MDTARKAMESLAFSVTSIGGTNPPLRITRLPWTFPKYGDAKLRAMARKFDFPEVIGKPDGFSEFVRLAKWVHKHMPGGQQGQGVVDSSDPLELLELIALKRGSYWCSHYAAVMSGCGHALGLPVRSVAVDGNHEKDEYSWHHGTNECYSTRFRKWFHIDPLHAIYFEKDGVPLNIYEVDREWLANKGKDVHIFDLDGKEMPTGKRRVNKEQHISSLYHFFYIPLMQDPFPGQGADYAPSAFFEDAERRSQVWWTGNPDYNNVAKHPGYNDYFMPTERLDDMYFDINTLRIKTRAMGRNTLAVSFESYTPNRSHFLYKVNDGAWQRFSGKRVWNTKENISLIGLDGGGGIRAASESVLHQTEVAWKLKKGRNTFTAKAVNSFGVEGALSSIEVDLA